MLPDALDAALAAIAPTSLPAMVATDPEPLLAALDALPASAIAWAERVLPVMPAGTIAAAGHDLAPHLVQWGARDPLTDVLVEAFTRPDVIARLAASLAEQRQGASRLVPRLRARQLDVCLLDLARPAMLPGMRREALYVLIEDRVRWRVGREKRWIDKSSGLFRTVPAFAMGLVERPCAAAELLALGLADRSAEVRRATQDVVMLHQPDLVPVEAALLRLAADRHRSIRERADFLRRHGEG